MKSLQPFNVPKRSLNVSLVADISCWYLQPNEMRIYRYFSAVFINGVPERRGILTYAWDSLHESRFSFRDKGFRFPSPLWSRST